MGERPRGMVSIVDDDASLRRSVRNLLASAGFSVQAFVSAEEFLNSPRRAGTGCLVLDLRMTGMSGLDLLEHLRATGASTPVVILTAHGDAEACRRAMEAGAVAFLGKPFRSDALLDAVTMALDR